MDNVRRFFARYEEGANSFDPEWMSSLYMAEFMAGDPHGVSCGKNDDSLKASFSQRKAFFEQIGFRRAKVLNIDATPLDGRYTMAKIHWQMTFEKDPGSGPKAAFWISHEDEQAVMRDAGLIPAAG